MKIEQIEVSVRQTINVGKYETINPLVSMSATLNEDDDAQECIKELHRQAAIAWSEIALIELSWVRKRRPTETHEFDEITSGTKTQLKSLLVE